MHQQVLLSKQSMLTTVLLSDSHIVSIVTKKGTQMSVLIDYLSQESLKPLQVHCYTKIKRGQSQKIWYASENGIL